MKSGKKKSLVLLELSDLCCTTLFNIISQGLLINYFYMNFTFISFLIFFPFRHLSFKYISFVIVSIDKNINVLSFIVRLEAFVTDTIDSIGS